MLSAYDLSSGLCHAPGRGNRFSCKRSLLLLAAMLFGVAATLAQTTITGTVKNEAGTPLAAVSVQVKNAPKTGTTTNAKGEYTIKVTTADRFLVFSSVGFKTMELRIDGETTIDAVLQPAASSMDEVIVTGYTQTMRKDLTGAVGTVNMEDLQKAPVRSFTEALAGRVAGVQVTSQDGKPGSPIDIVIRGVGSISQSNAPLYVIDGFPIEDPDNNLIDPNNIESITILKDASSTALYGARGSNGVIVITTKKGVRGVPRINYAGSMGVNKVVKYMKQLSAYEYVKVQSELLGTANPYFGNGKILEDYRNVKGTDWQDQLMQTGTQQNHSLSLSGGNNGTVYSFAGNYFTQEGIMVNSGFTRYQGKMTLDQQVGTKAKIGGFITYTSSKTWGNSPTGTGTSSLFYHAFTYRPLSTSGDNDSLEQTLYDPDGNGSADYRVNPILSARNEIRNQFSNNILGNVYIDYTILRGLKLRLRGGMNTNFIRNETFNGASTRSGGPNGTLGINGSLTNTRYEFFDNTNLLDYTVTIGKAHHLSVVAGNSVQKTTFQTYGYSGYQIPDEALGLSGIDAGVINTPPTGRRTYNTMASWLASFSYNYKSRYYLTGNIRSDGSSKFVEDNKWSYFPSAAIKWKLSEEKFLVNNRILSDANIRVSYGITGNNRIGDFDAYSIINFNSPLTINGITQPNSAVISSLKNPSLKWESTTAADLGVDLAFFNDRLTMVVDVYKRTTKDLLYRTSLPPSTGYSNSVKNIASISNRGLEITLSGDIVRRKDFTFNSSFNISFNRNKLESLSDPNETAITSNVNWESLFTSVPAYIAEVGGPLGQMYGYISDGLYQYSDFDKLPNGTYVLKGNVSANQIAANRGNVQPGDQQFRDINNDGQLTADDRVVIGNGYPLHTGGWSNNFRYKNFDLNLFFQWSYGNSIINANRMWFEPGLGIQQRGSFIPGQNTFAEFANRWTPENQNTDIPRLNRVSAGLYSSQYVEDGSYLRIKTLNVGYNLPTTLLKRYKVSALRIYVAASNLYTLTHYKGFDPEVSAFQTTLTPGLDYSAYPRPFTITGGINLSF
jgi:TonB-linked SusC/RagA family outer membrane protein